MIGRKIGRFRVLSKLGQGGMATVWKARDELLGRDVALKVLDEKLADSATIRRRFLHEAQTGASLDHPGAVAVFDSGEADGAVYIAMRLVDGETLSDAIGRRLLPIAEAVRVVAAVADVLAHAHGRGIVHRDVSSRNIMIGCNGRVFVLDFGLALANWESRVTSSGVMLGTAPYMAPEVIRGQDADPRTDLYSLGVVFYEALTGTFPFAADSPVATAFATLHTEPIPPRERRADIPEALERVVLKAISREPGARYQKAEELLADLDTAPRAASRADRHGEAAPPRVDESSETAPWPTPSGRQGPLYLAIRSFEVTQVGEPPDGAAAALACHLNESVGQALSRYSGVRVVPRGTTGSQGGDPREVARQLGANALLDGTVSRSGPWIRVSYQVLDPRRGVLIGGDVVEGAAGQTFDLADRVVASLASVLKLSPPATGVLPASRPRDPAAADRYRTALGYLKHYDDEAAVDGAIHLLEQLIESEGDVATYHAALGRAYLHKQQLTRQRILESRAASACERAKALDPDAAETLLALGDLQVATGRPEAARRDYERALEASPELFDAHLGLSRALEALGKSDEAEAECRRAIQLQPNDWRGHNRIGLLFFYLGQYEGAAEAWRKVTELAPGHALGWLNLASALCRMDRFGEAVADYRRSIEIQPTAMAYANLGSALYYIGRYEEAIAALKKATELGPLDAIWWGNLGSAYRWIPGHEPDSMRATDRAIELGRDFVERNPGDAKAWARLAGWLANRGRAEEALDAIRRSLEIAPQNPECMVRAGHVYFQLGDRAEALRWIREAVRHGYGVAELQASREFAPLRGDPEFEEILEKARKPQVSHQRSPM